MLKKIFGKNFQRKHLQSVTTNKVMQDYFSVPFPAKNSSIEDIEIVALDIETTGLDLNTDKILSFGMVSIKKGDIQLNTCSHKIVRLDSSLPEETVVIHQITDDITAQGQRLEVLLPEVLENLKGKVMLAHHAAIETGFLNKACQQLYQTDFIIPVIDTQVLAKRRFDISGVPYKPGDLRLFNLQKRFKLPVYKSHNALLDALTTAECFLVLMNDISPGKIPVLKDVLTG